MPQSRHTRMNTLQVIRLRCGTTVFKVGMYVGYGMFPRDYGYGQMGSRTFKGLDNGGFGHLGIVRYWVLLGIVRLLGHNLTCCQLLF